MEQLEDIRRKTLEKKALNKSSTRQMLRCYRIGAVIRLLLGGLLIGCNRRPATYHRENGWYHVVNTNADGLVSHTGKCHDHANHHFRTSHPSIVPVWEERQVLGQVADILPYFQIIGSHQGEKTVFNLIVGVLQGLV